MGASHSAFDKSLITALGGNSDLYALPNDPLYQANDVKPYNQDIAVAPAAVTYPKTAEQVAAIIKCAVQAGLKVQARCGGHSYANYCATLASYLSTTLISYRYWRD
jgi:FAD/FMN-containing dehydrogenase